jgi:hypothetical protein
VELALHMLARMLTFSCVYPRPPFPSAPSLPLFSRFRSPCRSAGGRSYHTPTWGKSSTAPPPSYGHDRRSSTLVRAYLGSKAMRRPLLANLRAAGLHVPWLVFTLVHERPLSMPTSPPALAVQWRSRTPARSSSLSSPPWPTSRRRSASSPRGASPSWWEPPCYAPSTASTGMQGGRWSLPTTCPGKDTRGW